MFETFFWLLKTVESIIVKWGFGKKLYFIFWENSKFKSNLVLSSSLSFFATAFSL